MAFSDADQKTVSLLFSITDYAAEQFGLEAVISALIHPKSRCQKGVRHPVDGTFSLYMERSNRKATCTELIKHCTQVLERERERERERQRERQRQRQRQRERERGGERERGRENLKTILQGL